ncbi:MAG: HpcH/HpaI aldolase/citrate lyase family protein [Acidimicrobiia bacterium]
MAKGPTEEGRFATRLREGGFLLGSTVSTTDPSLVECMARSKLDFLMIDTEHSPLGPETVQMLVIAASGSGMPSVVRVGSTIPHALMQPLDVGAAGIVVPRIKSHVEVQAVIEATRYPPLGLRGFGPRRAAGYGRDTRLYVDEARERVAVIVQIETYEAVEDLEAIAGVAGLDALLVGPNDLAAAMGVPGEPEHEMVIEVVSKMKVACDKAGVAAGIAVAPNPKIVQYHIDSGLDFVISGGDVAFLTESVDTFVGEVMRGR